MEKLREVARTNKSKDDGEPLIRDPVLFEIILNKVSQITEEMGINYARTSGSPTIVEANDMNTSVVTADGSTIAVGPFLRKHAPVFGMLVKNIVKQGFEVNPGDVIICNDPYLGVLHQPDVSTLMPVFHGGELKYWVGTTGHQVDIGGIDPGGLTTAAKDVQQEGLRMPLVKIVDGGKFREDVFNWIMNQVRDRMVGLDVKAQLAANKTGKESVEALFEKYGMENVSAVFSESLLYSEARVRSRLSELHDGAWSAHQYIDPDGRSKFRVNCEMTKEGDRILFDFRGTSPQARMGINCPESGLRGGILTSYLVMLAYDLPWNQGVFDTISVAADAGSLVNCSYPAPCAGATVMGSWAVDNLATILLSRMFVSNADYYREQMAVWCGSTQYLGLGGVNRFGRVFSMAEMSHHAGAGGARAFADGVDTGGVHSNATPSIPNVEFNESHYPVLYLYRRHLRDSGGPGKYRGGASAEFAFVPYDCKLDSIELVEVGNEFPAAHGLSGGHPGGIGGAVLFESTDVRTRIGEKKALPTSFESIGGKMKVLPCSHPRTPFSEDQVLVSNWQGAGGYGDPLDRDPNLVLEDCMEGLVSRAAALEIYGVVLEGNDPYNLDHTATKGRRHEIRRRRLGGRREPVGEESYKKRSDWSSDSLWISEYLLIDKASRRVVCGRCGHDFGSALENYKEHAVSEERRVKEIEFGRGKVCDRGEFFARLYYCPSCATQLEVDVLVAGGEEEEHSTPAWDTSLQFSK